MTKKIELIDSFALRSYQESIITKSLNKNTLVVLPTGLGKTIIALMTSLFYFNKTGKKILFLAPTKPLVEQQKKSFQELIKNSDDFKFEVLTGLISPKKRVELYKNADFIFATPQLIENDIINRIIPTEEFSHLIFDEAHRGTGGYAYCFIAQEFNKKNVKLLALTASPGTTVDEINQIMENLCIDSIQVKKYDDKDVKPYVHETKIDFVEVELEKNALTIKKELDETFKTCIKELQKYDYLKQSISSITKRVILDFQRDLRVDISNGDVDESVWKGISLAAALMKLMHGIELFESQDFEVAYNYFHNFFRSVGDFSKAAEYLTFQISFRNAYQLLKKLIDENIEHPKSDKLKEIIQREIKKNKELKIIVFSQYREIAQKIVRELSKEKGIKPVLFIGQSKKGDVKLSQKEQKKVIVDFREEKYNILVSTSVGEEGLDIPKVDMVIFYEPIPSAIRSIQRIGRTGRFKKGRAIILQTKGTKDIVTRFIATAKEKRMYKSLDTIQLKMNTKPTKKLTDFFNKKDSPQNESISKQVRVPIKESRAIPIISENQSQVYIDNRENTDLIKKLYAFDEMIVESKQLEVGDIVLSENIGIERKAKIDFVNSIIDKRLFPQLINLARNFKRPLLILEGNENIFALRNVNPNVIRAALSAISIDLRIPIIETNSIEETSFMIRTMCKRLKKDKKDFSLVADKKSFSNNEELEKFVSSIPKINVVTAKILLQHFKSIENLLKAKEKDFVEVKGIGKLRAQFLYDFFRRKYK